MTIQPKHPGGSTCAACNRDDHMACTGCVCHVLNPRTGEPWDRKHPGGRPATVKNGRQLSVWLSSDDLTILDTVRAQLGWSRSRAIRELVQQANRKLSRKIQGSR